MKRLLIITSLALLAAPAVSHAKKPSSASSTCLGTATGKKGKKGKDKKQSCRDENVGETTTTARGSSKGKS